MSLEARLEPILEQVQKPARYIGGELNSVVKDPDKVSVRFALCFPDLYEIGMSHLGMKILYSIKNKREDIWCERVFAPAADMEAKMREHQIPLYGLESLEPIADFDLIGFSLQYELCYTTLLNMLDLAGLPVRSSDRKNLTPIVMAGGPCTCNPEPLADFVDLFVLGEGEEVNLELIDLYQQAKQEQWSKEEYLRWAAQIPGVYVPSLYQVTYGEDGTIREIASQEGAPAKVTKRIIRELDQVEFPERFVVPFIDIVHDRSMLEVQRGCIRGCRFCQAGFIYRPIRDKRPETLNRDALNLSRTSGYDEVSLTSLSTSDYEGLEDLLDQMLPWTQERQINIALPSLRIDNCSEKLMAQIAKVRKSGLTFAPEAGTQRLRDAINKNLSEEEILSTCRAAFRSGYTAVKLYFMIGLPTETMEDVAGIADLAQKVVDTFYQMPEKPKGKGVQVTVSVSCFVPKPYTPFEFEPQDTPEQLREKQKHLLAHVRSRKISVKYHDSETSVLEAALARGDRRLGAVLESAWRAGSRLDGWGEHFSMERWTQAFAQQGLDPGFYAHRRRDYQEIAPWSHLDYGVSRRFLIAENKKAWESAVTPHCRERCSGCGAAALYSNGEVKKPCKKS
ncbi:MAG: TIGR03960 family B12-binding radical SAM protein [Oscillospiraceae bacterium]